MLFLILILLLIDTYTKSKENITVDNVVVKKPKKSCRSHFSGKILSDHQSDDTFSEIFVMDECSEYVGKGLYPRASRFSKISPQNCFDGIAIDKRTRIIIYSEENFKGNIILDEIGPKIITNVLWLDFNDTKELVEENNYKDFKEHNSLFPSASRIMSGSNMHKWSNGSLKKFYAMIKFHNISTKDYTPISYHGEYYHRKYELIKSFLSETFDKNFSKILAKPVLDNGIVDWYTDSESELKRITDFNDIEKQRILKIYNLKIKRINELSNFFLIF